MPMKRGQMWAPFKVLEIDTFRQGMLFGVARHNGFDTGYVQWDEEEKAHWVYLMDIVKQDGLGSIAIRSA